MRLVDIHSHIQFPQYKDDRKEVLARMKDNDVVSIVVGVDLESSKQAVLLAEKNNNLYASVGLHPNSVLDENFDIEEFEKLLENKKTVSVGECGLDYFRTEATKENKEKQKEVLGYHVELAIKFDLPLMIHCRNARPNGSSGRAYEDLIEILSTKKKKYGDKLRGNIHFFAGDWEIAQKFLNLNFTLSFTGVITFTGDYDEVIANTPMNMIMSETDCPFVTPTPHRGKRNEPIYVKEVIKRIAEIKGEEIDKTMSIISQNAHRVFNI